MRLSFFLFLMVGITVLFSANISFDQPFRSLFFYADPDLPEIDFEYEVELPNHLRSVWTHYDSTNNVATVTNKGATLGRVLFYDELLSANNNIACATCHKQQNSFADDKPLSMGIFENTSQNTPHLNDLGWANRFAFFWDMRVTDFKEAISLPLSNPNELGNNDMDALIEKLQATSYYPELFESAFGSSIITEDGIKESIIQFICSFNSFDSKIDRVQKGEVVLNELEAKGQIVYETHCKSCHSDSGPGIFEIFQSTGDFTLAFDVYQDAFNNGLPLESGDIGTGVWHPYYSDKFKIVTLRNLTETAPYMHDGRFETIEEVIEHYNSGIIGTVEGPNNNLVEGGLNLSADEKANLITFLKTFTDESILTKAQFSNPFPTETSINDTPTELANDVRLYPNPTVGQVQIEFVNEHKSNIVVECYDLKGQLFRKISTHQNNLFTDIAAFPTGVYLFKIFKNNELWRVEKVMKQ